MIPIRDNIPSKNVPIVNNVIICVNVIIYTLQLMVQSDIEIQRFIYAYGLVPARYTLQGWSDGTSLPQQATALFSYMFLHGGLLHLLSNMWFLYIFGDNVEDRLGPLRYTAFYLLSGLLSGMVHMALNVHSTAPTIGASGAVAGVMGAYILLHPKSKILTLIPIIIIPWIFEISAFFFLGFWFLIQLLSAYSSYGGTSGIAWWAHIGGFVCGMILLKLFGALPSTGITDGLRKNTARKKSYKFQMAHPTGASHDANIHATISISPYEALVGTRKMVTVPYGLKRRMFRVDVPPGLETGKRLRLKGQGGANPDGQRGDLILKVIVQ